MRLTIFIVAAIVELVAAIFGLFVLLLSLNGFSERQATPSLIFYVVFCLVTSLVVAFLGTLAAKTIVNKGWLGKPGATVITLVLTSIINVVFVAIGLLVALIVADFLRRAG